MFTLSIMTTSPQHIDWIERVEGLFLRFGIKSITMDEVAADLGISKKTLYQFVESKDDLVIKVLESHIAKGKSKCNSMAALAPNAIEEIFIILDSSSQEKAQMKANIVYDLQKYHREAWELMQRFQHEFILKIVKDNLLRGRKEGLYRDDFDIDIVAKLHLATSFNMFDQQMFPEEGMSKVTLFKEYMMHYLHGIVSPKGLTYLKKKLA